MVPAVPSSIINVPMPKSQGRPAIPVYASTPAGVEEDPAERDTAALGSACEVAPEELCDCGVPDGPAPELAPPAPVEPAPAFGPAGGEGVGELEGSTVNAAENSFGWVKSF
jgi:hypothetical protein